MDKAIKALEFERSIYATDGGNHIEKIKELDEAIAELTAHKAKIESLKEYCKDRRAFFLSQNGYLRAQEIEKILQKLEELNK